MYVNKSRDLPWETGVQPQSPALGLFYNPYSFQNCANNDTKYGVAYALALHASRMQAATSHLTVSDFLGHEVFSSTTLKRPRFNNCNHSKLQGLNLPFAVFNGPGSSKYCGRIYPIRTEASVAVRLGYGGYTQGDLDWLNDRSIDTYCGVDLGNAQRNAWHAMQPRFEGRISLINALLELKDFKDVLGAFAKMKPWRIARALRRGVPRSKKFDPSRPIAGAYLTNALAIQPTLRDAASIMIQIRDMVLEKQAEFIEAGESTQKSHWSIDLCETLDGSTTSGIFFDTFTGKADYTRFTATMEYQYAYKARPLLDAFVKYWGLGITYEALWNAIPMGFVLDYFASIGTSIHNMEHDKNVDLRMSQYCESLLRYKGIGKYIKKPTSPYSLQATSTAYINGDLSRAVELGNSPRVHVSGYSGSTYTRVVKAPNQGAALPILRLPSNKQWTTMAALLRTFL